MTSILLDTNAYSRLLRKDPRVDAAVASAENVHVSTVVCGELEAGFRGGSREMHNRTAFEDFIDSEEVDVLPLTRPAARIYGRIWQELRRRGRPIPTNDIWIAAQAIEADALLVTYDRHFLQVPDLRVWPELESAG